MPASSADGACSAACHAFCCCRCWCRRPDVEDADSDDESTAGECDPAGADISVLDMPAAMGLPMLHLDNSPGIPEHPLPTHTAPCSHKELQRCIRGALLTQRLFAYRQAVRMLCQYERLLRVDVPTLRVSVLGCQTACGIMRGSPDLSPRLRCQRP